MTTSPELLRFPRGVRFATHDEIPQCTDAILDRIANAKITVGYTAQATDVNNGYSAYIEANVHADRVWEVFERLANSILPSMAAPIVGRKEDELTHGPYTDKDLVIPVFIPYKESLQHDGFIEFGLVFQDENKIEEIFVKSSKYIQVWTNQAEKVEALFSSMGVPRATRLNFIDAFPRVTEALSDSPSASDVISSIVSSFEALPQR